MRYIFGAFALMWAVTVTATPMTTAEKPLTLGTAIALVLENNPQLQAADFDAKAAAARIRQQSQKTPWQLGITFDNFAGSGESSGIDGLEAVITLGRVLELGDKHSLRGEVAQHNAGILRHEQNAQRLDLLAETATRYITAARVEAERELAKQQLTLMQSTLNAVEQRYKAGKAGEAERSRAQISLAKAELALEETSHRLANSHRQLAILWGEFIPAFNTISADLMRLQQEPGFASLDKALERNPAIASLATMERLADARIRLAEARSSPDLDIFAGPHAYNDTGDVGLFLHLKMPLGTGNRAQPFEDEASALAKKEPLLAKNKRLALRVTLFALHQELLHDRDRFLALRDRIIPAAEKALKSYTRGYNMGRYSLVELTQAQETLLQARIEAIDAAADHHQNRYQIDRLIGTDLTTGAQQ